MRLFNAFQLVCCFIGLPYFIKWSDTATFWGAGAAYYTAIAVYVVMFGFTIAAYDKLMEEV